MNRRHPRARAAALQRQGGFTLVEVMVTVFVVAVGLLSAAALQAVSKKATFDAIQRSAATVLAQDMVERLRANSQQISNYNNTQVFSQRLPTAPACGSSSDCAASALVAYDIFSWWQSLDGAAEQVSGSSGTTNAGGLRSPTGCITVSGNVAKVVIAWRGLTAITQGDNTDPTDPTNDSCGLTNTDYTLDAPSNTSFRRVLVLNTAITQ